MHVHLGHFIACVSIIGLLDYWLVRLLNLYMSNAPSFGLAVP
jgi:hypothetical protein